jgi:hypothetical protein
MPVRFYPKGRKSNSGNQAGGTRGGSARPSQHKRHQPSQDSQDSPGWTQSQPSPYAPPSAERQRRTQPALPRFSRAGASGGGDTDLDLGGGGGDNNFPDISGADAGGRHSPMPVPSEASLEDMGITSPSSAASHHHSTDTKTSTQRPNSAVLVTTSDPGATRKLARNSSSFRQGLTIVPLFTLL